MGAGLLPLSVPGSSRGVTALLHASPSHSRFDSPRGQRQNLGTQWGLEIEYTDPFTSQARSPHLKGEWDSSVVKSPSAKQPIRWGALSPGALTQHAANPKAVGKGWGGDRDRDRDNMPLGELPSPSAVTCLWLFLDSPEGGDNPRMGSPPKGRCPPSVGRRQGEGRAQ